MYEYDRAEARPVASGNSGMGGVVTIANLLFTATMLVALIMNKVNTLTTVLVTGVYFGLTTTVFLFIVSGALTDIFRIHSNNRTHLRIYGKDWTVRTPSAEGLPEPDARPAPQLQHSTYVPAADDGVRREALAWAVTLFGRDGQPHPDKVNMKGGTEPPGRLKTAAPSNPEVKQFLLDRKVIVRIKNGYKLHLGRCPSAAELRENLR